MTKFIYRSGLVVLSIGNSRYPQNSPADFQPLLPLGVFCTTLYSSQPADHSDPTTSQQVSAFDCVPRCRVAAFCTTLLFKSRANDTFCTTFHCERSIRHHHTGIHTPTPPPTSNPLPGLPTPAPAPVSSARLPLHHACREPPVCLHTAPPPRPAYPHRHRRRRHLAPHPPRLRHTTRAPQAWRAVSHPPSRTRAACPSTVTPAPSLMLRRTATFQTQN